MRTLTDLSRQLNLANRRRGPGLPPLALMTDTRRLPDPLPVAARLPKGSFVVLRHYDDLQRAALGGTLARLCRARGLTLLVAGDFDLAVRLKAGLHLPEGRARLPACRIRLWHRRTGRPLTTAAHSRKALTRAADLGADAAFLGAVFPTMSHPGQHGLGALAFRRLTAKADLPVYALGGVTLKTLPRLFGSRAIGIATVSGLALRQTAHPAA